MATRTSVAVWTVFLGLTSTVAAGPLPPSRTGHFYVSNYKGDDVVVYRGDGAPVRRFSDAELDGPRGIVIGPNRIFVAAQDQNAVIVFNGEEEYLDTFTAPELDGPAGMATGPGGLLYVCSVENNSIVAFAADGSVTRSFTGRGLKSPTCIATGGGWIYVAGPGSPWIFRFDGAGRLRGRFTGGGLVSPAGIAVYGGLLYVSDRASSRVVVLDGKGVLDGEIAHRDLQGPQGLAFDDRGHLFVSGCFRNTVVEFDQSRRHVQTLTGGKLSFPDGVAFARRRVGDVDDDGVVGIADFSTLIDDWGACPPGPEACSADVTRNGEVDVSDLYLLLAHWD